MLVKEVLLGKRAGIKTATLSGPIVSGAFQEDNTPAS